MSSFQVPAAILHPLSDLAVSLQHTVEVICSGSYLHKSELNEDAFRLEIPFTRSPTSSQLHANQKATMLSSENQKRVTSTQTSLIIAWHWLQANRELLSHLEWNLQRAIQCQSSVDSSRLYGKRKLLLFVDFYLFILFFFSNLSLWPLHIMGSCWLGRVQKHYTDVSKLVRNGITLCQQLIRLWFNEGEIQLVPKGRISR